MVQITVKASMRAMFPATFALIASCVHDNNSNSPSVEATERKVETIQIPGTEVKLAPEKPEVSPLPHTARETSVGKLMPSA